VPLLRELPGFREFYLLDGGPDVLISIRVFDTADEALASNEISSNWMRTNVLVFAKGGRKSWQAMFWFPMSNSNPCSLPTLEHYARRMTTSWRRPRV
jgi:hypothetical protein